MRDHDDGDPHDLSFPTKHFPRASMVDNLVMSLDQFSSSYDTSHNQTSRSQSSQRKGHAKSSSISLESSRKNYIVKDSPVIEIHRVDDEALVNRVDNHLLIQSEEEEESQREKNFNAQRATQMSKALADRGHGRIKHRSDSTSSSIDLGHLSAYAGRLGGPGNRRSQSFDYGSTRPQSKIDATATPMQSSYRELDILQHQGVGASTDLDIARRNSGRSAKRSHSRKRRSGTFSATAGRSRLESPHPYVSSKNPALDNADTRSIAPNQNDQSPGPRAGFFRRVFGSSNRSTTGPSSYPSPTRYAQDRTGSALDVRRPTTPPGKIQKGTGADSLQNKENQPVVSKKPSSFFRRRRKSNTGGVPPPMPLTLNNSLDASRPEAGGSSPVSSLRALMDPYLAEGPAKHTRGTSLQSVQNAGDVTVSVVPTNFDIRSESLPILSVDKKATNQDRHFASSTQNVNSKPITMGNIPRPYSTNTGNGIRIPIIVASDSTVSASEPTEPCTTQTLNAVQLEKHTKPSLPLLNGDGSQLPMGSHPNAGTESANVRVENQTSMTSAMIKLVPQSSGSDTSDYKSAPSTPLVAENADKIIGSQIPIPISILDTAKPEELFPEEIERAQKIFDNLDEQINLSIACAWLGEAGRDRERIRTAFMSLFNWTSRTILAALRNLCLKIALRGETQQVDRVLDTFAERWCECNPNHGFKSSDVVHTIGYSILLLNTDLHLADIGKKMTRSEFVRNAIDTIRENVACPANTKPSSSVLVASTPSRTNTSMLSRPSIDRAASSLSNTRPTEHLLREESHEDAPSTISGPLVEIPFSGSQGGWELQVESVLKDFYSSISREPLPLFGTQPTTRTTPQQSTNNLSSNANLRRTPSTISKATSENRGRYAGESRSLGARWVSKTRSRPRLGATTQGFGSSRTSIDDQSSAWSPSMSSTWSKASLGKTLTSMSVDSFGTDPVGGGYQSSIGFANALSQAIIRDEQMENHVDEGIKAVPLLEDESLELYGAPWAKEGILKHKCHLEGIDKRSKDRNWNDCFAVIEKGWMRLFSFSMTAKSLRNKARNHKAGDVVGGGNWQDNAEEVWKFMLRHTIASSLPPPGYSKQRPYVWALSLPNGAVHLFSVGTPDIVKEFVSTANFWSARLSKEPMASGISSMEHGWSDSVINRCFMGSDNRNSAHPGSPRPSTQLSMRSSIDHGNVRPRLPGDKAHISEWVPPQQSLVASQLLEVDQLKALLAYVQNVEEDLERHNELRAPMSLAFSTRHPNSQKAMTNWEKKSSYLLREIVKFRTYIDALQSADITKQKVDKMRKEEEHGRAAICEAGTA